jgi:hypothetical protein
MTDSMCQHCGGLIAEPMKAYGWAGKWCHCGQKASADGEKFVPSLDAEIEELRRRLARLEDQKRRKDDAEWMRRMDERHAWLRANPIPQPTFIQDVAQHFPPGTILC